MCGRYYLGESEETSFWVDRTMQSSLVKEALTDIYAERAQAI